MIGHRLLPVLCVMGLSACASNPYGNYAQTSLERHQKMADLSIAKITALYPPAHTRFDLQQWATDPYGSALVSLLRAKGYALFEYTPKGFGKNSEAPSVNTISASSTQGIELRYTVDTPKSTQLYRVTLHIGNQSISRAFAVAEDGQLYPAGAWARKE